MKIFSMLLGILILVNGGVYGVLFTQGGNNILKPYIESYAKEYTKMNVVVDEFILTTDSITLHVTADEKLSAKVDGALSIFSQTFDLKYQVVADGLVTPVVVIKDKMSIDGEAKGNIKLFTVNGKGDALGSNISYDVTLANYQPQSANIIANNLKIADILGLLGEPQYADGLISLNAKSDGTDKIVAQLNIFNGKVNTKVVEEKFGIALEAVDFSAQFDAHHQNDAVKVVGNFYSTLANLALTDSKLDIKDMSYNALANLKVDDLANLSSVANMPLVGEFGAKIEAKGKGADYEVTVTSNSLGGELRAKLDKNEIDVKSTNLSLSQILYHVAYPKVADAKLNATLHVKGNENAKVNLAVENGLLFPAQIKESYDVKIPQNTTFSAKAVGEIDKGKGKFNADILSTLANLNIKNGIIELNPFKVSADYVANVEELARLESIVGYKFNGALAVDGKTVVNEENLYADGKTDVIGGVSSFVFDKNELNAKLQNFTIEKISAVAGVPYVFESVGNADLKYNLLNKSGDFSVVFPQGKILQTQLTSLILIATKHNLAQDIFENIILKGVIEPQAVKFNFDMKSKNSSIVANNGVLNRENMYLDVPFAINIDGKDLEGTIKGEVSKAEVKITASKYIEQKIEQKVDKLIEKNVPEENRGLVKDLLKLF